MHVCILSIIVCSDKYGLLDKWWGCGAEWNGTGSYNSNIYAPNVKTLFVQCEKKQPRLHRKNGANKKIQTILN